VVVVYRPGSGNANQSFFDEFDSLLERLSTYSAPVVIVGDFNIYVDNTTDTGASKLRELLSTYGLLQHVRSATHRHGHTLDLLITRDDQVANVLPIDPPLLSDHSFVVATVGCVPFANQFTSACQMRHWCEVDVDENGCSSTALGHNCFATRRPVVDDRQLQHDASCSRRQARPVTDKAVPGTSLGTMVRP